ncbi:MAG: hypothetical protein KF789_11710, partial [Bdellovibrionaceae bacterium]|nr:hypothetical protein [Pseudobdellovibrionaceae bacterium]
MKTLSLIAMLFIASVAGAQNQDAPPNEPPYVNEEEHLTQVTEEPAVVPAVEERPVLQRTSDGKQFIKHPLSKKGLQLIDKDGSYYYATEKRSKNDQYMMIRMGAIDPGPDIQAADGTSYATMYGS